MDFQATAGNQVFVSSSNTLGYAFSTDRTIVIEALTIFDNDGLTNSHQTRLWTLTGTELASVTLDSNDATFGAPRAGGSWRVEAIAPIELTPGNYVIGAHYPGTGQRDAFVRQPNPANLSFAPGITFLQDLAKAGNTFPDSSDPTVTLGVFGPSFVIRDPVVGPDSFEVTTLDDVVANDGQTSLREAITSANANANASTVTFAEALQGSSVNLSTVGDTELGNSMLRISTDVTIRGPVEITRSTDDGDARLFYVDASGILTLDMLTLSGGEAVGGKGGDADGGGGGGGGGFGGAIFNRGSVTVTNSTIANHRAQGGQGGRSGINGLGQGGASGGAINGNAPDSSSNSGAAGFNGAGGGGSKVSGGSQVVVGSSGAGTTTFGAGGGGGGFGESSVNGPGTFAGGGRGGSGGFGGGGGGEGDASGGANVVGQEFVAGGFGAGEGRNSGGGGGAGLGGAIFNDGGTLTITNSTLSGNSAVGGNGGDGDRTGGADFSGQAGGGFGGAIFNRDGSITVTHATIANNSVGTGGGGNADAGGTAIYNLQSNGTAMINIASSILASTGFRSTSTNDGGAISGLNNLVQQNGNFPAEVIAVTSNPMLGPLQSNGGPTQTHALLAGSPAIDAGGQGNAAGAINLTRQPSVVATQSSTLASFTAELGLNGNNGDFTHTLSSDTDPTWQVSFAADATIQSIVIHNREDCCAGRLRDITVEVLDDASAVVFTSDVLNPRATAGDDVQVGPADLEVTNLPANLVARSVRIRRMPQAGFGGSDDDARVLSLSEVTVQGVLASSNNQLTSDQRGGTFTRVVGPQADIGAFELDPPPTISVIEDLSATAGALTDPITITIGDLGTALNALTVSASSSNGTLIPESGFVFGGSGANRTLQFTPASDQTGTAEITVTVTDANGQTASDVFLVTVNPSNNTPTITDVANVTTAFNTATPPIQVTVGDVETAAAMLVLTATSSDQSRVPDANIVIGGSGANRTVTITPGTNQSGAVTITLTVTDEAGATASDTFGLTINAANAAPTITVIADQQTPFATATGAINFTIGDDFTALSAINLSASSSNTVLVAPNGLVLGGSGETRSITITPAADRIGTATITITAVDAANLTFSRTFNLVVTAPPADFGDAPASYGVSLANGGALHRATGATLGPNRDVDADGQASADARGDDQPSNFGSATRVALTAAAGRAGSVAIGDLNGDGNPDMVVAVSNPDSLDVLLGNGDGTFGNATSVSVGAGSIPNFVVLDDFDGDSILDAVVQNRGSDDLSLLIGNGNGTFDVATLISLGSTPASIAFGTNQVASGDINGDGDLDLVVIGLISDDITVLVGNGDGTFAAPVHYPSFEANTQPGAALTIILADIDDDDDLDAAVANFATDDVTVLLNNGSGVFAPGKRTLLDPTNAAASGTGTVAAGDFNGDGSLDLVSANNVTGVLNVLIGNKTDTFALQPEIAIAGANGLTTILAQDIDGDSNLDVVVTDQGGAVFVVLGNGDGTFQAATMLTQGLVVNDAPFRLALADLDNDGLVEIITDVGNAVAIFTASPDDEEGVTFPTQAIGTTRQGSVTINLQNADANSNLLDAWIDFNRDGDWNDDGEQIFAGFNLGTANGPQSLTFTVPSITVAGQSFARFRLSTTGINTPGGFAIDGEVEDHAVTLVAVPANAAPTITDVANQTTTVGTATGPLAFTIGDAETPVAALVVTAASSNQTLVPDANLVLAGAGANRTVTVTPAAGQTGSATITISVADSDGTTTTETFVISVALPGTTLDFGDAPGPYPVTLAQNGARHTTGPLFLGTGVDVDVDGQPSALASADVDDGVTLIASLFKVNGAASRSSFRVVASQAAKLDGWIDFNDDGDWNDADERIFNSVDVNVGANILSFSVPTSATVGDTFARFRLSTLGALSPTGTATDGEVEDYLQTIVDGDSSAGVTITIVNGTIRLSLDNSDNVVRSGATELFRALAASIDALQVNGTASDDTITIDFASGFAIPTAGLRIDGGEGTNTLMIDGAGDLDLTDANSSYEDLSAIVLPANALNTITIDRDAVNSLSPTTKTLRITSGLGDIIDVQSVVDWRLGAPKVEGAKFVLTALHRQSGGETIEVDGGRPFRNFLQVGDVDNSGAVTAGDALAVIFELNQRAFSTAGGDLDDPTSIAAWPGIYYDANGDGRATAADALNVINILFLQALASGEGESAIPDAIAQPSLAAITLAITPTTRDDQATIAPAPIVQVSRVQLLTAAVPNQIPRTVRIDDIMRDWDEEDELDGLSFSFGA